MREKRINELLESISNNEKYRGCVFWGRGIYFVIGNGEIWEISNDASCSPRGGWFPSIITGPTEDENRCLTSMMEKLGFDETFFSGLIEEYCEFDEDYVEEYFDDNEDEDSLKIYNKIKKQVESGKTPFETVNDFANALVRYGLENTCLYYEWEGEYIDLHDNISETGESRGYYDNMNIDEWINLLENIDDHIVTAD